jgi:hypothetical protein
MNHRAMRSMLVLGVVAALGLSPLACRSRPMPSPIYVYLTPTPAPTAPPGSPTAAPSGSQIAVSTPTPGATATASASAGNVAAACTGSEDDRTFFATAAAAVRWGVYCAVLPGRWHIASGTYTGRNGGVLEVSYDGPGSAALELSEGAFCTAGASACSPHDAVVGPVAFDSLAGTLYTWTPSPGQTLYVIYVSPGTGHAYTLAGSGLSESSFRSIAGHMYRVLKP